MSELYEAVEAGKLDVVQDLINKGVDFNTPNEDSEKTILGKLGYIIIQQNIWTSIVLIECHKKIIC